MQTLQLKPDSLPSKLLGSRKAVMAAAGFALQFLLVPFLNSRFGLGLSADQIEQAAYPFIAYVLGQGLADFGKERKS